MESSHGLPLSSVEQWAFWTMAADLCISEKPALDTQALSRALQISLPDRTDPTLSDAISPPLNFNTQTPSMPAPHVETLLPKRRSAMLASSAAAGKSTKRKSRASKRTTTTFIAADASNFRQMVQQVTGARIGDAQLPVAPMLKPQAQRPVYRVQSCLPTLDTSSFWLERPPQVESTAQQSLHAPPRPAVAEAGRGLDLVSPSNSPAFDSWKAM